MTADPWSQPADRGLVVVDVETTGLGHAADPPRRDAIVQVGLAWRSAGELRSAEWTCRPSPSFFADGRADDALRINHLTMTEILAASPETLVAFQTREEVLPALHHRAAGLTLFAYNVTFDRGFLEEWPWSLGRMAWGECLMARASRKLGRTAWVRLVDACAAAGIDLPPEQAHTAAGDARAAYLLMEWLDGPPQPLPRSNQTWTLAGGTMTVNAPADNVVSPGHYHLPGGLQAWEVIEDELGADGALAYHRGAKMKYRIRAGRKPGASAEQDLAKARQHQLRAEELTAAKAEGRRPKRPPMPLGARHTAHGGQMKSGDRVERNDGAFKLVVGVVDGNEFMALGWPPTLERVEDFMVIEECTPKEELETLLGCAGIRGEHEVEDWRAVVAKRQLRERGLGGDA